MSSTKTCFNTVAVCFDVILNWSYRAANNSGRGLRVCVFVYVTSWGPAYIVDKARTRCLFLLKAVWGLGEFITFTQKYVKISSRSLESVIPHLSIYRKVTKSSENVHLQPRISTICSFASWNVAEEQFSKYVIIFWQDSPENINHFRHFASHLAAFSLTTNFV